MAAVSWQLVSERKGDIYLGAGRGRMSYLFNKAAVGMSPVRHTAEVVWIFPACNLYIYPETDLHSIEGSECVM